MNTALISAGLFFMLCLTGCATQCSDEPAVALPPVCRACHQGHPATEGKLFGKPVRRFMHADATISHQPIKKPVKMHPSTPLLTQGFATVMYQVDQQPIIHTAPFQITVIRLEPGEKFTNISSGDPSRWSYAVAISGQDETAQQNILVKPSMPDISTNLVITTDKRLYNLLLMANQTSALTRNVEFSYPEAPLTEREESPSLVEEAPSTRYDHHGSSQHYRITTAGFWSRPPPWQPVRVFDEGEQTIIQFPDNIAQQDLPALFILNGDQKACVNYHFQSPYMKVDKHFSEATLVSGVGSSQQAVLLTHLPDEGR